jgi:hypothetical protein
MYGERAYHACDVITEYVWHSWCPNTVRVYNISPAYVTALTLFKISLQWKATRSWLSVLVQPIQ